MLLKLSNRKPFLLPYPAILAKTLAWAILCFSFLLPDQTHVSLHAMVSPLHDMVCTLLLGNFSKKNLSTTLVLPHHHSGVSELNILKMQLPHSQKNIADKHEIHFKKVFKNWGPCYNKICIYLF